MNPVVAVAFIVRLVFGFVNDVLENITDDDSTRVRIQLVTVAPHLARFPEFVIRRALQQEAVRLEMLACARLYGDDDSLRYQGLCTLIHEDVDDGTLRSVNGTEKFLAELTRCDVVHIPEVHVSQAEFDAMFNDEGDEDDDVDLMDL
jgi:hypothetical protein